MEVAAEDMGININELPVEVSECPSQLLFTFVCLVMWRVNECYLTV